MREKISTKTKGVIVKKSDILAGNTYSNGKEGKRSISERKVLAIGTAKEYRASHDQSEHEPSLRYLQVKGRFSGKEFNLSLESFASWAKKIIDQ